MRGISAARVRELRFVDLEVWCHCERDPRASEGFCTPLHEDFLIAMQYLVFCPHRVYPLEDIVRAGGEEISPYLTYLPGLADLLRRSGSYVDAWVREFYDTLWVHLDHEYI